MAIFQNVFIGIIHYMRRFQSFQWIQPHTKPFSIYYYYNLSGYNEKKKFWQL